jgi:hypothetical protein
MDFWKQNYGLILKFILDMNFEMSIDLCCVT